MNFAELRAELLARGFDYLATGDRDARLINQAMHEVEEAELWPFREESASGTAPLQIADLGQVEKVLNSSNEPLTGAEWSELVETYGDVSTAGTPGFWYLAWPGGVPTVAVFPESSETIGVQYWKVSADLTGTDDPLIPERFHGVIVDVAVRMAYRDADNHAAAEALQASIDRDLMRMRQALFGLGPGFIRIIAGSADW